MAGQRIGYVRGLASITFLNNCNTSIQLSVDPQFRGRVLALYLAVLQAGLPPGHPSWDGSARNSARAGRRLLAARSSC